MINCPFEMPIGAPFRRWRADRRSASAAAGRSTDRRSGHVRRKPLSFPCLRRDHATRRRKKGCWRCTSLNLRQRFVMRCSTRRACSETHLGLKSGHAQLGPKYGGLKSNATRSPADILARDQVFALLPLGSICSPIDCSGPTASIDRIGLVPWHRPLARPR